MRRSVLVAILVGALAGAIAVGSVSLAGSGSSEKTASPGSQNASQASFKSAYAAKRNRGGRHGGRRHGHRMHFGPMALALSGVAERLGVSKGELIDAAKGAKDRFLDRAVADGTITQAERDALGECIRSHHRRGAKCDNRRAARRAHRKLRREVRQRIRTDAAGLKAQAIGDLAAELGKDPEAVEAAIRAELVELLDTGVRLGFVTDAGRDRAIGCFDRPDQCDLKALRREFKRGHRRGRHP